VIFFEGREEQLNQQLIQENSQNVGISWVISDVKGQESIKRCMEIAAAGGHNIILVGRQAQVKTMLAKRLPSILP
jgi:magnesium chelatase family protein